MRKTPSSNQCCFSPVQEFNSSVNQAVYRGILAFAEDDPNVLHTQLPVHKQKVLTKQYAFIGDSVGISMWAAEICDLFVFPEPVVSLESNVIFTPKNSSITRRLNGGVSEFVLYLFSEEVGRSFPLNWMCY